MVAHTETLLPAAVGIGKTLEGDVVAHALASAPTSSCGVKGGVMLYTGGGGGLAGACGPKPCPLVLLFAGFLAASRPLLPAAAPFCLLPPVALLLPLGPCPLLPPLPPLPLLLLPDGGLPQGELPAAATTAGQG